MTEKDNSILQRLQDYHNRDKAQQTGDVNVNMYQERSYMMWHIRFVGLPIPDVCTYNFAYCGHRGYTDAPGRDECTYNNLPEEHISICPRCIELVDKHVTLLEEEEVKGKEETK